MPSFILPQMIHHHVTSCDVMSCRVFLVRGVLTTSSDEQQEKWISAINLVAALQSGPPLPAGVGSVAVFRRPMLPESRATEDPGNMLQVWVERERQLVAEENEVSPLLKFFLNCSSLLDLLIFLISSLMHPCCVLMIA